MWNKTDTKTCDNFVGVNPSPSASGGDNITNAYKNNKPRKYAVVNRRQLVNMIKELDNKSQMYDDNGNVDERSTIVLHFRMASKKAAGQLTLTERDGSYKSYY
mgnify:FL=1